MRHRSLLRRLGVLALSCSLLLMTGCDYLSENWTKPIGESQQTAAASSAAGSVKPGTTPGATSGQPKASPLLISEFMSNNVGSLTLPDGSTPDWIELYNAGDTAVSLNGYMLSDNTKKPEKYVFKSGTLAPGACLLLYASSSDAVSGGNALANAAGGIVLPFGISSSGEELILTAPDGTVADQWTVPAIPADISHGRNGPKPTTGSAKAYFGTPTPGKPNGADGAPTPEAAIKPTITTLLINEFCTRNASFYDERGDYPDWVELYNSGSEPLDLSGFMLTDDLTRLDKWTFPKTTLAPKAYLLLMLTGDQGSGSGQAAPTPAASGTKAPTPAPTAKAPTPAATAQPGSAQRLQVDFRLSDEDKQLLISDTRGRPVATAAIEALPLNVSKGRLPDKPDTWGYFPRATPGTANSTASFPSLSQANSTASKTILVSEVFAQDGANTTTPVRDWIELYNNTDKKIDLTGYGLTDKADEPFRQKLANVSVNPKSTVVIEPQAFSISANGETIVLTSPEGIVEDAFATGYLRPGCSSGRKLTGEAAGALDRFFYVTPTRNAPNTTPGARSYAALPAVRVTRASDGAPVDNLYIDQAVKVTLAAATPDTAIYYTLDGTDPGPSATPYREPITVDRSLVLKAVAVRPDHLGSDIVTRTLLKEKPHTLPVVSLSGNAADITGPNGILANAANNSEVRGSFTFYEADGREGVSFNVGLELHGQYSRTEAQKSFEVKIRSSYGNGDVTYPFFPGYDVSTFRRLVMRTSGQDWKYTKVRDAFITRVIQGQLAVDMMAVRNCVLYVNGAYHGLYEVREKIDQFYIAAHYGIDPDQVDMIKGTSMVVAGDIKDYQALINFMKANDMRSEANYQKALAWIDEDSLIDFVIAESFFSNPDSGNKKFWRPKAAGGQWRWVVFDMDWAMFPTTYQSDRLRGDLLDPAGHGQGNFFQTVIQVKLLDNPEFREKFIKRYANFINTTFATDRMLKILDDSVALVEPEIDRQIARWGMPASNAYWKNSVATLRRIVSEKRKLMIGQLQTNFSLSPARLKELFPGDYA